MTPIAQIVYLVVSPENLDAFLAEVRANARESIGEKGVLRFEILQQAEDPCQFLLYEVYESQEALENHRQTTHFARWLEYGVPLLSKPRERMIYHQIAL